MKHQYFGDVNDYRKYGLLRTLQRIGGLRLGVCWMLTADDDRADGGFISYLGDPNRWRFYDPELFDCLVTAVTTGRSLENVRERNLLLGAVLFEQTVPDDRDGRARMMSASSDLLRSCELVFFDPDNGMEIASCQAGQKRSSKYLLLNEVIHQYKSGSSVLIYQHFRREERGTFISTMEAEFRNRTGCTSVVCFRTSNVAFFLLIHPHHVDRLLRSAAEVSQAWKGQIEVIIGPQMVEGPEPLSQRIPHLARAEV